MFCFFINTQPPVVELTNGLFVCTNYLIAHFYSYGFTEKELILFYNSTTTAVAVNTLR